ncbi:hypothetical protein DPMN_089974, partial [Dreissena polymorpha]
MKSTKVSILTTCADRKQILHRHSIILDFSPRNFEHKPLLLLTILLGGDIQVNQSIFSCGLCDRPVIWSRKVYGTTSH